jgi:molecular chaperone DnaJ
MKFASPCPNCGGTGYLPGKQCRACDGDGRKGKVSKIRAKIPAGVDNNSKVRLSRKGNSGRLGGPPGDLIITINVSPHKFFKRKRGNLEILLPVTYLEAAMGGKIKVPTLGGMTMLKIPPSTSSGQKLRLKGKGLINPKTKSKGDMVVEIKIVPPPTKDIEVRKLLKKIEEKAPYHPRKELGE